MSIDQVAVNLVEKVLTRIERNRILAIIKPIIEEHEGKSQNCQVGSIDRSELIQGAGLNMRPRDPVDEAMTALGYMGGNCSDGTRYYYKAGQAFFGD